MPQTSTILPLWLTFPIAAMTLLFLAGYAMALQQAPMAPKRRRIRTANTIVMMLGTCMLASGVSVIPPASSREFVLVWLIVMWLMAISVLLACLDATATVRTAVKLRRQSRAEFRAKLERDLAELSAMEREAEPAGRG